MSSEDQNSAENHQSFQDACSEDDNDSQMPALIVENDNENDNERDNQHDNADTDERASNDDELRDQFVRRVVRMAASVADNQQQGAVVSTLGDNPILDLLSATLVGAAQFAHAQRDSAVTIAEYEAGDSESDEDGGVLTPDESENQAGEHDQQTGGRNRTLLQDEPSLPTDYADSDEEMQPEPSEAHVTEIQPMFSAVDLTILESLGLASGGRGQSVRAERPVGASPGIVSSNRPPRRSALPVSNRLNNNNNNNNNNSESESPDDAHNVRIRVPIEFLDASATSSNAPRHRNFASDRAAADQYARNADPSATSQSSSPPNNGLFANMSTTTSQQTTPDVQEPMRPRPTFVAASVEPRRVAYPPLTQSYARGQQQAQQQQQHHHEPPNTSFLPDPLEFVQSLVAGSLFEPQVLVHQQQQQQTAANQTHDASEGFQFVRHSVNVQPCTHGLDSEHVYDNLFAVPLTVCDLCESAVLAPSDRNENVVKALRLPESMRRDNRFQELFDMHREHIETSNVIKGLLEKQRSITLRLFEWHRHYSDRLPRNYLAQNNPCYRELSRSLDRHTNALQAFSNMSEQMVTAHRRRFVKAVHRTFPRNQIFFKAAMRYEIHKAQPNPMLLPGVGPMPKCTVCGEETDVRLHSHAERYELVRIDPFAAEPTREPIRQCQCQEFVMCLDCLLDWYYDSSEKLTKTFAKCPTCKAQFHLEDIVRVRTMSSGTGDTNKNQLE